MTKYELLTEEAHKNGLSIKEKPLQGHDGRICKSRIAIRRDIETTTEKTCVLAEELGHYQTTAGDILDQTEVNNRKQELRARLWSYNKLIGLYGIIRAFKAGCHSAHEAADYLDVTEKYFREAISCYQDKYGVYAEFDNYIIYFIPYLAVKNKLEFPES